MTTNRRRSTDVDILRVNVNGRLSDRASAGGEALNASRGMPSLWNFYSCGLSTATIEYSCPSVCLSVCVCFCVCVCVCVHDNSKNNGSIDLKL